MNSLDIIRQRPKKVEIKKYAVELMNRLGAFEYTRKRLQQVEQEISEQCKLLGGNEILKELVDLLHICK